MIRRMARKSNLSRRELIAERFERGESQVRIARSLGLSPASVRYYLRLAGVPGAVYGKRVDAGKGKRVCSRCGKAKTPGAFGSPRHTVCRMCYKS